MTTKKLADSVEAALVLKEHFGLVRRFDRVKKAPWERGPWDGEPDAVEWRAGAYACLIIRHSLGHLCGYVGVPLGHPAHRVTCEAAFFLSAHGGVNYAGKRPTWTRMAATIALDEPELWWFGFDCAHAGDKLPAAAWEDEGVYRTVSYCRSEIESLIAQLEAFK